MKTPKGFTAEQVFTIYTYSAGVTGEDFPRAFRICKEIRALPEFFHDKKAGQLGVKLPKADDKDEIFLHMKPSDLPAIWKWIKERNMGRKDEQGKPVPMTPAILMSLEDIAKALGQAEDYATVVEDMTTEPEEKEEADAGAAA